MLRGDDDRLPETAPLYDREDGGCPFRLERQGTSVAERSLAS
jgi:hypothetical protein